MATDSFKALTASDMPFSMESIEGGSSLADFFGLSSDEYIPAHIPIGAVGENGPVDDWLDPEAGKRLAGYKGRWISGIGDDLRQFIVSDATGQDVWKSHIAKDKNSLNDYLKETAKTIAIVGGIAYGAGAMGIQGGAAGSAGAGIGQAGVTHLTPALMESAMVGGQAAGYGISSASLGNLMGAGAGGAASSLGVSKMFGSTFKDAFAQSLGSQAASSLFGDKSSSTATSKLDLSPEGYNKIIRDILASDEGLASLATGENLSGGYGSSTKAQLAQDLVLNIAGELAKLTAPKTESKTSSSKKKLSVICTELNRQGYLSDELYEEGKEHFNKLPIETLTGYRVWADKLVPKMQKSQALTKFFAPIVQARYELVVQKRFSLLGAATIYLGQPICYVIGCIVLAMRGDKDGDISETA